MVIFEVVLSHFRSLLFAVGALALVLYNFYNNSVLQSGTNFIGSPKVVNLYDQFCCKDIGI